MPENFIDNASRKRLLLKWIPLCLIFLHFWATILIISVAFGKDNGSIRSMFTACSWGIAALILLLISDRALEFIITRLTGQALPPQIVEKTVTERTVTTPSESTAKDMNVSVAGDINVNKEPV